MYKLNLLNIRQTKIKECYLNKQPKIFKHAKVIKGKERLRNYFRLTENKKT